MRKKGLVFAVVLWLVLTACTQSTQTPDTTSIGGTGEPAQTHEPAQPEESEKPQQEPEPAKILEDFTGLVRDMKTHNEDTVGWLHIPGTNIYNVVLFKPQGEDNPNNSYYLRRNFEKEFAPEGSYFIDFTADIGQGSIEELCVNTTIHGATLFSRDEESDDITIPEIAFGALRRFQDEEFARAHPYIYFSTSRENMAFEIVAVFISHTRLPYHREMPIDEYLEMFQNEIKPRSLYHYDTQVNQDDKFLTLSTGVYLYPDGSVIDEPDWLRFAVVGRLVGENEPLRETAAFTVNPGPVLDSGTSYHGE